MKIERIEPVLLRVPFIDRARGHAWRGRDFGALEMIFVRVETADGITGWGECFSYNCQEPVAAALSTMVAPLAVGRDSRQIGALMFDLQRHLHIYGRYGIQNYALSGLDIALWDIAAKRAARPLVDLLGGARETTLDAYASMFRYNDPDQLADAVRAALKEGFHTIKLHERGVKEAEAAREAAGAETPMMMDTNCAWSPREAFAMAHALRPSGLRWLEEPVFPPEDFGTLAALQAQTGIPIATGENACTAFEFDKMIRAGAASYVQPSVTKVGGVTELRKVAALAEVGGVEMVPHSPYFGPGLLATLHLVAAQPRAVPIEYFRLAIEAKPFGERAEPKGGSFALPTAPGLGLEPDAGFLATYRVTLGG